MTTHPYLADAPPQTGSLDDDEIRGRAAALAEEVVDDVQKSLVVLHAAAILLASLAADEPDPFMALDKMLATQARTATDIFGLTLELRNHHNC